MSRDRTRRSPWDDMFFDIDDGFNEMRKRMDRIMERMIEGKTPPENDPMIYGFSMRIGPDGKPMIHEFGNATTPRHIQESAREPLTDVIEEAERIRVIVELPGVEKKDIHLNATEETLDIEVDSPKRRFSKHLELPSTVDPDSATAGYNNGVLEIRLSRVERRQTGKSIEID